MPHTRPGSRLKGPSTGLISTAKREVTERPAATFARPRTPQNVTPLVKIALLPTLLSNCANSGVTPLCADTRTCTKPGRAGKWWEQVKMMGKTGC